MKDVLEKLACVDGIHAAALFDPNGGFMAAAGDESSARMLERCHDRMREGFGDRGSVVARTAYATVARFERGTLVVRGLPHATLVVLGDRDLDVSVTAVGFHIAIALRVISLRANSCHPGRVSGVMSIAELDDELAALQLRPPPVPKISSS